ncbi:MAG: response regulator [Xenococcaceae cyanobacterium MO_188.B32]|nr:response regulator [Xenococcaceae cyanobacterium MO_188.B32]
MSLNPDIRDRAYQFFIEEARELLQTLETGLLNLSEDRSTDRVHELMRAAHSLKGGAASVDLDAIKTLAHRLEDFFQALYSDKVEFDSELESLLLEAYDCLRSPLNEQIETGAFDTQSALVNAEPIFTQIEELLGDALKEADNYVPISADLGIDIVASIFEVDVAQSLERLTTILADSNREEVIREIKAQAKVFTEFAELFNLPGFGEIARAAIIALDNHPEKAVEIGNLMLADCQVARDSVLEGERLRGGEPSEALLALSKSEESVGSEETESQEIVSLESVFGDELEISSEEEQTPVSDEPTPEIISLDSVFGDDLNTITGEEQTPVSDELTPDIISLDSVFGDDLNTITEQTPVSDEPTPEIISLDSVFGDELKIPVKLSVSHNHSESKESLEIDGQGLPQPNNLDEAIQSIEQIFDKLPPLQSSLLPPSPSKPKEEVTITPKDKVKLDRHEDNKITNLTVRIDLNHLERMNNIIGELVINRNSLSLQNEQLQQNVKELVRKFARFHKITVQLREFADRLSIESEKPQSNHFSSTKNHFSAINTSQTEFDSLEMDRYSQLHILLQKILEEMMQLEEGMEDISLFARQSDLTIKQQRQMLGQMRDELMWARMLPLDQILQRFPRILRNLSNKYQKPVTLKTIGTGVLVDRAVLEKLYDPLMHLLRNAFDHGIEPPEFRRQQGKSAKGNITISAYYQGNQTVIEVQDDGRGLNLTKIASKAIKQGLLSVEQAQIATKEELLDLIFEAGFSTADKVSELSGRGVGMNVVRSQLQLLKGTIKVDSSPGEGTTFTLKLPLTLTIAKLLVCSLGSTAFALPSDSIEEIIIPKSDQIQLSGPQRFLFWNQQLIPIYAVKDLLKYNCTIYSAGLQSKTFDTVASPVDWASPLLLLRIGQQLFALEIDKLITEQELVIKPFGKAITPPSYTYGCTILGDGTLLPAIDGVVLINKVLGLNTIQEQNNLNSIDRLELADDLELDTQDKNIEIVLAKTLNQPTILVVDDSTALRRTMALSLEKQGYRVLQAGDGRQALDRLKNHSGIDLIICDIEMPNMNGFEFLSVRRRDSLLLQIPVIMLTSRSGGKHRSLAKQLGANAYFTKPYIEQEFLGELKTILSQKHSDSEDRSKSTPKTITNLNILIIDDSSALRRTMTLSLEKKGYRVLQARHGKEGLEQLKQNPQVNLIICDIEMPIMNGFEFLDVHRQDAKIAHIPVAMLSSRSSEKHRNLAKQLGAIAFFTKPYIEEEFLQEIKNLIKTHH